MARYIDADALIKYIESKRMVFTDTATVATALKSQGDVIRRCIETFPTADFVPKSEEGAECPTCHGTGRIGTTDWLTKGLSKKQIAEEKAKAVAEHEQHIKSEVAREIFAEIGKIVYGRDFVTGCMLLELAELKKKYTESIK